MSEMIQKWSGELAAEAHWHALLGLCCTIAFALPVLPGRGSRISIDMLTDTSFTSHASELL